jgi:hypothetical protein
VALLPQGREHLQRRGQPLHDDLCGGARGRRGAGSAAQAVGGVLARAVPARVGAPSRRRGPPGASGAPRDRPGAHRADEGVEEAVQIDLKARQPLRHGLRAAEVAPY